jgi:hypothetical protein
MNKKLRPSPAGGYPFNGVKSEEVFPNRILTDIVEEKVVADINPEFYPQIKDVITIEGMRDFLLDRIHDYNHALRIAENQIKDMREEMPFVPEDFFFEQVENEMAYTKNGWLAVRGSGTVWILRGAYSQSEVFVDLPNSQIAFITLRAMGVIKDEEFEAVTEIEISEKPKEQTGELSKEYLEHMEKQAEHNKHFGQGVATWNEEKNRFIVPEHPKVPQRLWGTEVNTEEFEWIRTADEIADYEREVANA